LFEEKKKLKTSSEIKREQKEQKLAEAKRFANELNTLYNTLRGKFTGIEKSGAIPEEGVLRGFRKNLQYLSSGIRKLRITGVSTSFSSGQVNILSGKLTKWMSGEGVGGTAKAKQVRNRAQELDEILNRIKFGTPTVTDTAVHDAIRILREIAKDKIVNDQAKLVAQRARKLMYEKRKSEIDVENFIKDRFVVPVLSKVYRGFLSTLENYDVVLDEEVSNYIETCVKGGKSRKEFINLLLEKEAGMPPPSQAAYPQF
jgi:hypothetical protein